VSALNDRFDVVEEGSIVSGENEEYGDRH